MKVGKLVTSWMRVAVVAALAALVTGCFGDRIKDPEELIGAYERCYPVYTEQLRIDRDGTYHHTILVKGDTTVSYTGHWNFDDESSHLILDGAMRVVELDGRLRPRFWEGEHILRGFLALREYGKVKLIDNPDVRIDFVKIPTEDSTSEE